MVSNACLSDSKAYSFIDKGYFVAFIIKVKYVHYLKSEEKKSKKKRKLSIVPLQERQPLLILAQTCLFILHTVLNLLIK